MYIPRREKGGGSDTTVNPVMCEGIAVISHGRRVESWPIYNQYRRPYKKWSEGNSGYKCSEQHSHFEISFLWPRGTLGKEQE